MIFVVKLQLKAMQEQMRKLVEESHTKKAKKKKKEFSENSRTSSQQKKKKPPGEIKPTITDSVSASISNVVRKVFGFG